MVCGECGSSYCGNARKERPQHRAYVSYNCQRRNNSIRCSNSEIKREAIEAFVLERLADYLYDERKIPQILASYEGYLRTRDKDKLGVMDNIRRQIGQAAKEIENIVNVVARTGSEALIERLAQAERTKKELEYRLATLEDEANACQIDAQRLTDAFKKARQYLRTGELKQTKVLLERYVKEIIIYKDSVEVFLNLGIRSDEPFLAETEKQNEEHQNPADQSLDSGALHGPRPRRGYDGGEGGTRTLAPVTRPTPLAGAPRHQLEYFSV